MAKKKFNYKQSLEEIQAIINEIEEDEVDVDELSGKIKKASELIKACKTQLRKTETEIENVLSSDEPEE
jgi:exodeoxyribonuclease VII small subunit